jgi:hypothetical protein
MEMAYLYRWTETSTGMWYVGSRYGKNCHPNDGYICSSRIVKPLIQNNQAGWVREVLVIGNPKDMRDLEARYLVSLDAAKNPMSYNRTNGNKNFHTIGKPVSEEHIRRLKENNPAHRPDVVEKLRQAGLRRDISYLHTEEIKCKKILGHKLAWQEGKYKGVGFKSGDENIAKKQEVREKISKALKNIKGGRMSGKKHSNETRNKMSQARRLYWQRKRETAGQNYTV